MLEEEDIVYRVLLANSAVNAIVAGRIYPDRSSGTATPYIIYSRITGVADLLIDGGASFDRLRVQVDCYAKTKTAAKTLALLARDALEDVGYSLGANPSGFDEESKLFSDSRDYSLIQIR